MTTMRERRPLFGAPVDKTRVLMLDAAPSDTQRAIREVITSMASDAVRAGLDARAECDRLDDTLKLIQEHVMRTIDDYATRVATVQRMYLQHKQQAVLAQRALYTGALPPPAPPAGLMPDDATISPDHETTGRTDDDKG